MTTKRLIFLIMLVIAGFSACKEEGRYETEGASTTPPGPPTEITWDSLYGGARFHYTIPVDEDLISVNAEYTNEHGNTFFFTSSFYSDSLDVYGFGEEKEYTVYLYGVNRAGKESTKVPVKVFPLEPAISRVAKTLVLKSGFNAFYLDWVNELKQVLNVYIAYKYKESTTGAQRDLVTVFSSNQLKERQFITSVFCSPTDPINVKVTVEDRYGNQSEVKDFGDNFLLEDYPLDKSKIKFPDANDSTVILKDKTRFNTGVPAMFGENLEGRMAKIIDGVIDRGSNLNFFHTGGRGRTGSSKDGNLPWNLIMDMGDYYQMSRINTVQRHMGSIDNPSAVIYREQYYRSENCGEFNLYYFDETEKKWVCTTEKPQRIPIPEGLSDLQYVIKGEAGDESYFYPDDPHYTPPARWFRFECLHCFDSNYTSNDANCLSEMTVYGKK